MFVLQKTDKRGAAFGNPVLKVTIANFNKNLTNFII